MSLPESLASIVTNFQRAPKALRLQLLLEFSKKVPPLPAGMDSSSMERVHECQTPFFLVTEVDDTDIVTIHFDAPAEAPTTRGFAGILSAGLQGLNREQILAVPNDFYDDMGLAELISPLRLRGMAGILARLKRQLQETT